MFGGWIVFKSSYFLYSGDGVRWVFLFISFGSRGRWGVIESCYGGELVRGLFWMLRFRNRRKGLLVRNVILVK